MANKDIYIYSTIKSEDTEVLGGLTARPNEIKAQYLRELLILIVLRALLKCFTILQHRDSSVTIPLPPDQHHCSDEAKWRLGGALLLRNTLYGYRPTFINLYFILFCHYYFKQVIASKTPNKWPMR